MAPNTQRYDYTYMYTNLCNKERQASPDITGTIYDLLTRDKKFSKTVKMVNLANLQGVLTRYAERSGLTMFVTEDKNIPDSFLADLDLFKAENVINAYLIPGVASPEYLKENGSAVYIPRKYHYNNPMIVEVNDQGEILVNKVGKLIGSISANNGYIHVLDNLAQVTYIN